MKRLISIAALAAALVLVVVPVAGSGTKDYKGPTCNNIVDGNGVYSDATGVPTVVFTVNYQAATCANSVYSFFVTDTSGNALVSSSSGDGSTCVPEQAGGGCLTFTLAVPGVGPNVVCVYATTAKKTGDMNDSAPDSGDPSCRGSSPEQGLPLDFILEFGAFR